MTLNAHDSKLAMTLTPILVLECDEAKEFGARALGGMASLSNTGSFYFRPLHSVYSIHVEH